MHTGHTKQIVTVVLAVVVVLTVATAPAHAHAYLEETDPEDGDQLEDVPSEITLSYTGDGIQVATVGVVGPSDEDVSGEAEIGSGNQHVTVPIEDGGEGMYIVEWEVLADDGHTTSGTFFFVVGDEQLDRDAVLDAHESEDEDDELSWTEASMKGLALVALASVLGGPLALAVAAYPVFNRRRKTIDQSVLDRRAQVLFVGAGTALLVSVFGLGLVQMLAFGSFSTGTLWTFLDTPLGEAWLLQIGASVGLLTVLGLSMQREIDRLWWLAGTAMSGLLVALGIAWTSHSATAISPMEGVAIDFVHLFGASLWAGGLLVLALVVLPLVRDLDTNERAHITAGIVRRYSVVAIAGVSLSVATGLVLASWHVTADGLTETLYGLVLLAKLALIGIALVLGGYHRFVLLGRLDPQFSGLLGRLRGGKPVRHDGGQSGTVSRLTSTVRLEVVVLVCILLFSGVLTSAPTAAVLADDGEPETATLDAEFDDDIDVELTAIPATEEDDTLVLEENELTIFEVAFERDGQRLSSDQPVELLATTTDGETTLEIELNETDDGKYTTVQTLPEIGDWELRISATPDGSFGSVWFDVTVIEEDHGHEHDEHDDHGHEDDHDDHSHDEDGHGEHDHGTDEDSLLGDPLRLGGLMVGIYGLLAVGYESRLIARRD